MAAYSSLTTRFKNDGIFFFFNYLMAAFSSLTTRFKPDVYISFCGEDVGDNFISHLNAALLRNKIKTFVDDELVRGDEISPSLLHAIEESKISLVVFSENYASSRSLLEELEKILECRRLYGQVVIPVYYHVYPVEVWNHTGRFGEGYSRVVECHKENPEILKRFKDALTEAANITGFYSQAMRHESRLIEEITKDIMKKLEDTSPKYERGWKHLSMFFLVMEAISVVLDVYGKSKQNFLLAAFVLSAFGFIITIYAFIRKRSTAAYKQRAERELAWVEVAFSVLQLVTLFIQYILVVAGVKDSYSPSLFPLVFALLAVVFASKKEQISHSQVWGLESKSQGLMSEPESQGLLSESESQVWRPKSEPLSPGWRSESESQGWTFLSVFFLVMEAISVVLDAYGKSKKNFLLAAFVLSAFGFIVTIYAFIRKRSTTAYRQRAERELAWVDVTFSVLQLLTLCIQYILAFAGVKDYSPSLFPLVFALVVVVFDFKKQISHGQRAPAP